MDAADRVNARPLRLVSFLSPLLASFYEELGRHLQRRLDLPVELVEVDRYDDVAYDGFADGDGDLALICGLPYVWLRERRPGVEPLAAPVPAGLRYSGQPWCWSDVLVRTGDDRTSLESLAGARWGYNEPGSHSGHGIVVCELARRGLGWQHFGSAVELGDHVSAVEALVDARIDVVAVDSHLFAVLADRRPDLASQVRAIEVLGPSTIQPVVAAPHVPAGLRGRIQGALLAVGLDHASRAACAEVEVERFVGVSDRDYDGIRRMARDAEPLLLAVPA